jgi:hypothetical protein
MLANIFTKVFNRLFTIRFRTILLRNLKYIFKDANLIDSKLDVLLNINLYNLLS